MKPTLTDAKRALKLWRSDLAPKELQRSNAVKWLRATALLGERWVLAGGPVKWGHGERSER